MTRQEWLNSLKSGDEVVVTTWPHSPGYTAHVKYVTDDKIILECGDGHFARMDGFDALHGSRLFITQPTPELLQEIEDWENTD